MEKHLTQCPLQLVECEFANAGCQVRVPRRDLARHMEEESQCHLLSISLLNLGLTRDLHQKMAEKDQQMAELQEQSSKLEKQIKDLQERTEKQLQTQLADLQQKQAKQITGVHDQLKQKLIDQRKETKEQVTGLQTLLQNENKTLQQQVQDQGKQIHDSLCLLTGFSPPIKITLTKFSVHKASGAWGRWYSEPFYSHTGGYKFQLCIDTIGYMEARGTHITAWLFSMRGEYDGNLSWPIQITAHLQLLNQKGDHQHMVARQMFNGVAKVSIHREIAKKFIAHSELGYNAAKDTQYLKDDCLHFQLYLKVDPQN